MTKKVETPEQREKRLTYLREYRKANRERLMELDRQRYRDPARREAYLQKCAEYRERNREKTREAVRAWRQANPDKDAAAARRWAQANPERVRETKRQYSARRRRTDLQYRLRGCLRTRLLSALKLQKATRRTSALAVGCTLEELRAHLEAQFRDGMTWDNHGTVWEIDHIYPLSKIDLSTEEGQRRACHYSNLQPLLVAENRRKAARVLTQEGHQ